MSKRDQVRAAHVRALFRHQAFALAPETRSDFALRALAAFEEGDLIRALALVDRCCRAFVPDIEHYRLRAALREALGDHAGAAEDLDSALALTPGDLEVMVGAMALHLRLGDAERASEFATEILLAATACGHVSSALRTLAQCGWGGVAWSKAEGGTIIASFAWMGRASLDVEVAFDGRPEPMRIWADPYHEQARTLGNACSVALRWPDGAGSVSICGPELLVCGMPIWRGVAGSKALVRSRPGQGRGKGADVTVIVPVYRNLPATRRCLVTLRDSLSAGPAARVVLVDDASPEPELVQLVRELALGGEVDLITHAENQGYMRAVESALAQIPDGDVVLLNADTVLTEGWLARLREAAHAHPDIGTVTPLSNNGELTSFPVPFQAAPLPSATTLEAIDRAAARVNRGQLVDVPNGIGFCLYIKRACLDRVGRFGADFLQHGYFEDVDFCLRAADHGFRSVCATDTFIGHVGSVSYGQDKRGLVLRNLAEMSRRYPSLSRDTSLFMEQDPLRPARERIVKALLGGAIRAATVVISTLTDPERLEDVINLVLEPGGGDDLILTSARGCRPAELSGSFDGGALPFRLALPEGELEKELPALLRRAGVTRLVYVLGSFPGQPLLALPERCQVPYEAVIVDGDPLDSSGDVGRSGRGLAFLEGASAVRPGSRALQRDLALRLPGARVTEPLTGIVRRGEAIAGAWGRAEPSLAVIPLDRSAASFREIRELALALHRVTSPWQLVVFGSTLDDAALMRLGNVFVLGPTRASEWQAMLAAYRCGAVFVTCGRVIGFNVRLVSIARLPIPIAAPCQGILAELATGQDDLLIGPGPPDQRMRELAGWLHRAGAASAARVRAQLTA